MMMICRNKDCSNNECPHYYIHVHCSDCDDYCHDFHIAPCVEYDNKKEDFLTEEEMRI